jgi:hypothetical protein
MAQVLVSMNKGMCDDDFALEDRENKCPLFPSVPPSSLVRRFLEQIPPNALALDSVGVFEKSRDF